MSVSPNETLTVAQEQTADDALDRSSNERVSPRFRSLAYGLFIVATLIFIAFRLWQLTSFGLFGDEVFSLWTAAQGWRSLFASVVGDVVHPPLFYVLLKAWIDVGGQSLLWLKLLPFMSSIVAIIPFAFLCRELKIDRASIALALWMMAVNGFLITHSQELRMYSLLLLLTICSLWLFARLVNRDSIPAGLHIALLVANLLLVFTHYYGWVVVGLELMFLLVWRRDRLKPFTAGVSLIAVCFAPWVIVVSQAARRNPSRVDFVWNQLPPLSELFGFFGNLNGPLSYRWRVFGPALVLVVFLTPVIAWGLRAVKIRRERSEFALLGLFAFGPPALSFLASHLLPQPVWAFRYLIIAAPAYSLVVAVATQRLKSKRVRLLSIVLIAGWAGLSGFTELIGRDRIAWEPLVHRLTQAESESTTGIKLYVTDANVGNTIQYYLDQAGDNRFQIISVDSLTAAPGPHWWIALIRYKHETQPLVQDRLRETGYIVGEIIESETSGDKAILFPVWIR